MPGPHIDRESSHDWASEDLEKHGSQHCSTKACHCGVDTRAVVRLIQCDICTKPFQNPTTLPCGNTVCRGCLPQPYTRQNISYPATENRLLGFQCPISTCAKEHAVEDASLDVTMANVMSTIESQMQEAGKMNSELHTILSTRERDGVESVFPGGPLYATYEMAKRADLPIKTDLDYTWNSKKQQSGCTKTDDDLLKSLLESLKKEIDCQVCYSLLLDPLTTPCGHTFCRKCIHRILDHSSLCPACRRTLSLPSAANTTEAPSNRKLTAILDALCPSEIATRKKEEEIFVEGLNGFDTPLFVCALSFPCTPTYLHIFEPRYRLMIRRVMATEHKTFGMVLYNPRSETQGDLGPVHFYQYGTMLQIVNCQVMQDGRSLIETTGLSRFKVVAHKPEDGYTMAKVERVDDISFEEEEERERREVSASVQRTDQEQQQFEAQTSFASNNHFGGAPSDSLGSDTLNAMNPGALNKRMPMPLERLSTSELFQISKNFVNLMQSNSATWLPGRVIAAYGSPPDSPEIFPWWLASVLPVADPMKYQLLSCTSVRERLRICAGWCLAWEHENRERVRGGFCGPS